MTNWIIMKISLYWSLIMFVYGIAWSFFTFDKAVFYGGLSGISFLGYQMIKHSNE